MVHKKIFSLPIGLISTLCLVACVEDVPEDIREHSPEKVKIGVVFPFTGSHSETGRDLKSEMKAYNEKSTIAIHIKK